METGHRRVRERVAGLGDEAVDFLGWYLRSRFDLTERFLDDLETPADRRDVPALRRRFLHAVRHAKRVLVARGVVTFLLALGLVATTAAAVTNVIWYPDPVAPGLETTARLLAQAAAVSGSASVLLLLLRLAFDRYLQLVDTCVTFLAMQLSSSSGRPTP